MSIAIVFAPAVAAIVNVSVLAFVVSVTLLPAAIVSVSLVLSAAIVVCPDTAMFPKALSPVAVFAIVIAPSAFVIPIPVPAVSVAFSK